VKTLLLYGKVTWVQTLDRDKAVQGVMLLLLVVLSAICTQPLHAQQDPLQSFYLNDKLLFNPAYAGSRERFSATLQYRHQWVGVAGAPRTAVATAQSTLKNERFGLGFVLQDDELGVTRQTALRGAYAYRIPAGPGRISVGLSGGLTWHRADLQLLHLFDEDDVLFSLNENRLLPSAGLGIWYDAGERFYASLSAPRLIRGAYLPDGRSREGRHFFASAGYLAGNGEVLRVRTMGLLRVVENAPVQAEVNAALELMRTVWIGAGLRSNPAVTGQLVINLPQGMSAGYSYDRDLRQLSSFSHGSHEVFFRYDRPAFKPRSEASPRTSPHKVF
jgi:type IX secretion system PorP/SprF family membrane protein